MPVVERMRVTHPEGGPILVKRAEQDSTDVNLIMDSWIHAGAAVAGHMNPRAGTYGDFSSGMDFHATKNAVLEAESDFMSLPPKVRTYVENDPGKLLDLVFDPERRKELEELGLVSSDDMRKDAGGPLSEVLKDLVEGLKKPVVEPPKAPEKPPEDQES